MYRTCIRNETLELTVALQEMERVVEALPTHVAQHLGVRGEEGVRHAVHVAHRELDARAGEVDVHEVGRVVVGTDVALAGERRHRDRVLVQHRDVVRDAAVNVVLRATTTYYF